MADPQQTLDRVMVVLAEAQGDVDGADWSAHDQAINAIMDSTTLFYLRTDPRTGEVHERVIWPTGDRFNYGMVPALVAPLVAVLREQTDAIDGLVSKIPGASESVSWGHWKRRLSAYEAAVAAALELDPTEPNADVWRRVTAPLLLGYYPADFAELGIANPSAKSRPDVTWTATTTFQIALSSSIRRQNWRGLWADLGRNSADLIRSLASLPAQVIDTAKRIGEGAAKGAKVAAAVGVLGLGTVAIIAIRK